MLVPEVVDLVLLVRLAEELVQSQLVDQWCLLFLVLTRVLRRLLEFTCMGEKR